MKREFGGGGCKRKEKEEGGNKEKRRKEVREGGERKQGNETIEGAVVLSFFYREQKTPGFRFFFNTEGYFYLLTFRWW